MHPEIKNIIQLMIADDTNREVAGQVLKNQKDLKQEFEKEFALSLSILGKQKWMSIFTLYKKYQNNQKLSLKEKYALIAHPYFAKSINSIYLADYRIEKLPEYIENLCNLEFIDLRINQLKELPPQFSKLNSLQKIFLTHNKLHSISETITQNKNLLELQFNANQISHISHTINNLQNLEILNLSNNKLSTLPEEISELQKLENLNLDKNQLQALPKNIGNLQKLKSLHLWSWKNQIDEIPESFAKLNSLDYLTICSKKGIKNLEILGECKNLEFLDIGISNRVEIPNELSNLVNLRRLSFYGYKNSPIKSLPKGLENLPNLRQLYLYGHAFPKFEQTRIKEQLPNCEILFTRW